jgi:hypothetical protein
MKKFFYLLTVAVFLISSTMVMAQGQDVGKAPTTGTGEQPQKTINCCVKGDCKKLATEGDCTKAGGKVVKDCKDCK